MGRSHSNSHILTKPTSRALSPSPKCPTQPHPLNQYFLCLSCCYVNFLCICFPISLHSLCSFTVPPSCIAYVGLMVFSDTHSSMWFPPATTVLYTDILFHIPLPPSFHKLLHSNSQIPIYTQYNPFLITNIHAHTIVHLFAFYTYVCIHWGSNTHKQIMNTVIMEALRS